MMYTDTTSKSEIQKRIVDAYANGLVPIFWKKGVAGIVSTPARKSRDHPFPPVAEAEYGPYAQII